MTVLPPVRDTVLPDRPVRVTGSPVVQITGLATEWQNMALAGRQSELAALDGALDRCTRGLGALQRDLGVALLFISHDLGVIRQVSDRIAVMKDGRIIETGDTDQVFASPRAEYTRELLEAVPRLDAGAGEVVRTAIPVRRSSP
jgi:hypothetical protein